MNNSTLNTLVDLIDAMQLKDRIKEAMLAAGLTKAAFSRATKASPGAITQWLSGETKSLKAETALAIESATGYRAGWIVDGKGNKFPLNNVENKPPSSVAIEGVAIKNGATLADAMAALGAQLSAMNLEDRKSAMAIISRLVDQPERGADLAQSIEMMLPHGFQSEDRKYG